MLVDNFDISTQDDEIPNFKNNSFENYFRFDHIFSFFAKKKMTLSQLVMESLLINNLINSYNSKFLVLNTSLITS